MNRRSFVKLLAVIPAAFAIPWKAITNPRVHGVNYAHVKTTPNANNIHVFDLDRAKRAKEKHDWKAKQNQWRTGDDRFWMEDSPDSGFMCEVEEIDVRSGEGWIRNPYTHKKVYGNFELRRSEPPAYEALEA